MEAEVDAVEEGSAERQQAVEVREPAAAERDVDAAARAADEPDRRRPLTPLALLCRRGP